MACVALYETLVLLINSCGATCFKKLFSLVFPCQSSNLLYDIVTATLSILI